MGDSSNHKNRKQKLNIYTMTNRPQTPIANLHRSPEYIKILHSIKSCTNSAQIETLRETVLRYYHDKKQDAAELMADFLSKVDELSDEPVDTTVTPVTPHYEDPIDNLNHKRPEAK